MSETTFRFELVCPEGMVLEQDVESVLIPGSEGDFMVFANHAPIISTLRPGLLEVVDSKSKSTTFYVSSGLAEISPTSLTILAQEATDTTKLKSDFFVNEIKEIEQQIEDCQDQENIDRMATQLKTMQSLATSLDMVAA